MCAHELHLVQPNPCPHIHRLFVMSWELAGAHEGHGSQHIAHDKMEQGFKVYTYSGHLYYWTTPDAGFGYVDIKVSTISRVTNEITHNAIKKVLVYDIKFNWTVSRSVAGSSSCGFLQELTSASLCSIEWKSLLLALDTVCGVCMCCVVCSLRMCLCACAVYVWCVCCVCVVCVCVCVCV